VICREHFLTFYDTLVEAHESQLDNSKGINAKELIKIMNRRLKVIQSIRYITFGEFEPTERNEKQ